MGQRCCEAAASRQQSGRQAGKQTSLRKLETSSSLLKEQRVAFMSAAGNCKSQRLACKVPSYAPGKRGMQDCADPKPHHMEMRNAP
jgi:hypothetical protein